MKESTLLKSDASSKIYNNQNDAEKINDLAVADNAGIKGYKIDYLGNDFVYDDYNQNPDLVQEDKHGYKVFFTRDESLISDFAAIRVSAYLEEFDEKADGAAFEKLQDDFDRKGRIIVVTRNHRLVGGMRLMFSDECSYLSNEYPGTQFEYKQVLKRYAMPSDVKILEVASVIVRKGERDFSATESMFDLVVSVARSRSCSYIFGTTLVVACRLYRLIFDRLGLYLEIVLSHPWERKEAFGFAKMFPIYVKIN